MRQRIPGDAAEHERDEEREHSPVPPTAGAVLALQRSAGNQAVAGMLARAEDGPPGAAAPPAAPLLLTDRPWSEIEEAIAARNREPFIDPDPLSGLAGITFPMVIEMPKPPLLLDSVPHAERQRLDANEQKGPGEYKRPVGNYDDESASAPLQAQMLLFFPLRDAAKEAIARLDREGLDHPEFKRLKAEGAKKSEAVTRAVAPDYSGVIAATEAMIKWIASYLAEKAEKERNAKVKDGGKFSKLVGAKASAAEAAGNQAGKKSAKGAKLLALHRSLVMLENDTFAGVSRADKDRFAEISAELDALLKGAPAVPESSAPTGPEVDHDDDGRTGLEPTLDYRGQRYFLIPGNPARTYGRIDPALRLTDDVNDAYLDALQRGFVPANEVGASGVKDKPAYFEIKLIVRRAKAIGVGNTARIQTSDRNGLVQASTGIRYLTFDTWKDAH